MTAGEDHGRHRAANASDHRDADGLGAFASESEHTAATPQAPRSMARQALESPALVSIIMALAVIGYGGLMIVWWDRETPEVKPSFTSTPTSSYQPASQPLPAPRTAAQQPPTTEPVAPVPHDLFVPAVARTETTSRPAETAVARPPAGLPAPLPDTGAGVRSAAPTPIPPVVAEPVAEAPAAPAAASPAPSPDAAITASVRPPEPTVADPQTLDRNAIGEVLQSYRAAYNALDATSASTIWQGLDTRALQRAFATLSQQDVRFDRCDVRVTAADHAVASCRGVLSYVPKIGDGAPQQRRLAWNFDFRRAADRWLISAVSAR